LFYILIKTLRLIRTVEYNDRKNGFVLTKYFS
jgi:hypothetical protein